MECSAIEWTGRTHLNIIAAKDSLLKISACIDYNSDSYCSPAVFHRIISQNKHRICQKRSLYSPKNLFAGEEGAVLRWKKKDNHFSENTLCITAYHNTKKKKKRIVTTSGLNPKHNF